MAQIRTRGELRHGMKYRILTKKLLEHSPAILALSNRTPSRCKCELIMTGEKLDEKAIFNIARGIDSAEGRAAYLHQACGTDSVLIERIQTLLRGYEEQVSFLESPPLIGVHTAIQLQVLERPGTTIGAYKLLQKIGEGGMGVVFMAEQKEPLQRTVALKIIKPGMDTRQVIARFEAERQAVAMMDHPNIAKVLDAGTTESGRPYFVMELVKGVPITKYCDEKYLPIRDR